MKRNWTNSELHGLVSLDVPPPVPADELPPEPDEKVSQVADYDG